MSKSSDKAKVMQRLDSVEEEEEEETKIHEESKSKEELGIEDVKEEDEDKEESSNDNSDDEDDKKTKKPAKATEKNRLKSNIKSSESQDKKKDKRVNIVEDKPQAKPQLQASGPLTNSIHHVSLELDDLTSHLSKTFKTFNSSSYVRPSQHDRYQPRSQQSWQEQQMQNSYPQQVRHMENDYISQYEHRQDLSPNRAKGYYDTGSAVYQPYEDSRFDSGEKYKLHKNRYESEQSYIRESYFDMNQEESGYNTRYQEYRQSNHYQQQQQPQMQQSQQLRASHTLPNLHKLEEPREQKERYTTAASRIIGERFAQTNSNPSSEKFYGDIYNKYQAGKKDIRELYKNKPRHIFMEPELNNSNTYSKTSSMKQSSQYQQQMQDYHQSLNNINMMRTNNSVRISKSTWNGKNY